MITVEGWGAHQDLGQGIYRDRPARPVDGRVQVALEGPERVDTIVWSIEAFRRAMETTPITTNRCGWGSSPARAAAVAGAGGSAPSPGPVFVSMISGSMSWAVTRPC
jgi:hypothetical protein